MVDPSVLKVEPALAFKIGDRVERIEPMYLHGHLTNARGVVKNYDQPTTDLGPMWVRVLLDGSHSGRSESFHPRELRLLDVVERIGELEENRGEV